MPAAAGAALLVLSTTVPVRTAVADDLVREELPCNLLCRMFLGRPEPADAVRTEPAPQSAGVEEPAAPVTRRRPRTRRAAAIRPVEQIEPAGVEPAAPGGAAPGPDLGAETLDDAPERQPPRRRVRRKRIAAKPAADALTVGRPPPTAPSPVPSPPAAAPARAPTPPPGEVTRVAPPPTTGDKASQEERRRAAIAAEEALSTRVSERARRALNSMCVGCLGRPAPTTIPTGRQVEPMTGEATPRRAP